MHGRIGSLCIVLAITIATLAGVLTLTSENVSAAWNIQIVDSADAVGLYTSIALDASQYPHISYYDFTNRDLKYAKWTGSTWSITIVDSTNDVGRFSSLALDSNYYPHISYLDNTDNDLKYARWTGSTWNIVVVDSAGNVGSDTSLALDSSDRAHISYFEFLPNYNLKYANWTGSAWNIQTVDSGGVVGEHSSIVLDSNEYPHISYHDYTNLDLKYTWWTGSGWSFQTVDSTGNVGDWTSLALDSKDYGHISYYDLTNRDLRYARWDGATWNLETIDSVGNVGERTSIALDASDYPRISYFDVTNGDLKYARWTGSAWNNESVDTAGDVGGYTSIALDTSWYPHISYSDNMNFDLKYAYWTGGAPNNPPGTPSVPVGPTSGVVGISYWYNTSARDPDMDNVQYTFDWGDGNMSTTGFVPSGTTAGLSHAWSVKGTYQVRARATDAPGAMSGWSNPLSVTISTLPTAPVSLTATAGDQQISLDWSPPADDGGSPIINYTVYRGTSPGGETYLTTVGNVLAHLDTGLVNGQTYYYQVAAVNAVGEGPRSNEANATPTNSTQPPTEPLNLVAVGGDTQITLTWSPPASDGGLPVTNYTVYRGLSSGAEVYLTTLGNVLTHPDTGLTNGITYYYMVAAVNSVGEGPNSTEAFATPATVPTEPVGLVATPGDTQVTLTWATPASDGGSPITNYEVYRGIAPASEVFLVEVGNVLTHQDTGLTNGVTYYYKVSAKNAVGEGPQSNEANATPSAPPLPPSEPLGLTAVGGNANITLAWSPPASDGGSPVTNYRIFRGTTPGGESFLTEIGNLLAHLDTGLTNGQTYYYKVSAVNAVGEGPQSGEASATPMTIPTAPRNLQAFAGDSQVTLTWNVPVSNGGSPITNYRVYRGTVPGGETFLVQIGAVLTHLDTGLVNGQTYYYQVTAVNVVGEGLRSNEASAIPTSGTTVPTEPLNLQAVAGDAQVTLTWSGPANDGGSPITNYRVYRGISPGGETFLMEVGNVLTHLDTGLANGQTYYYMVSAVNAMGEGPQSNEASATPSSSSTAPTAPRNLMAFAGNAQVTLTWDAPTSDGGSLITNYRIFRGTSSGGEVFLVQVGNVLAHLDAPLANGQTYFYEVSAVNAVGEGPRSNEANATPTSGATVPSPPLSLQATAGDAQVSLAWSAPATDGGSPVTNYSVYRGLTSGGEAFLVTVGTILTYIDTGVTNGQTYYYQVSAINGIGEGPRSNEASATPMAAPPVNQHPACTITAPRPNEVVRGQHTFTGTASDPDGTVAYVEVRIDGAGWVQATGTTSWSIVFDTTTLSDGQHTIRARAFDGTNHSSVVSITFAVDNASPPGGPSVFQEPWFWAVVLVVMMATIFLLVLLFMSRRKKKEKETPAEPTPQQPPPPPYPQ